MEIMVSIYSAKFQVLIDTIISLIIKGLGLQEYVLSLYKPYFYPIEGHPVLRSGP